MDDKENINSSIVLSVILIVARVNALLIWIPLIKLVFHVGRELASFFKNTSNLLPHVFHVSREINGIAHNLAHQVFRSAGNVQVSCFAHAHSHLSCPVVSLLSDFQLTGGMLHTVHCY